MTTDGVVVTCINPRIDPLAILGLELPRAAIVRTPGGRVTSDAIDGITVARALFDIEWIVVMHHDDCALHRPRVILEVLAARATSQPISLPNLRMIDEPAEALRADVELLAHLPGMAGDLATVGLSWDPRTGNLSLCHQLGPSHPIVAEQQPPVAGPPQRYAEPAHANVSQLHGPHRGVGRFKEETES